MDAAKLREILSKQYGINSEEEFNEAVAQSSGINIGIFTMPIERINNEEEARISA